MRTAGSGRDFAENHRRVARCCGRYSRSRSTSRRVERLIPGRPEQQRIAVGASHRLRRRSRRGPDDTWRLRRVAQEEPVGGVAAERDEVRELANSRKLGVAGQLERGAALERAQVELGGLWRPRQVGHAQDRLVLELADEREDLPVRRREQRQGAAAEGAVAAAQRDRALHPVQQRGRRALLRLDVASLVPVDGVHDDRRKKTCGIRAREAAVAIGRPLHRRAHALRSPR